MTQEQLLLNRWTKAKKWEPTGGGPYDVPFLCLGES